MTSLAAFTTTAAGLPPSQRRFVAGAAYLLYDRTNDGEAFASVITGILTVPQYANALNAAGLTATFQGIDAP